MKTITRFITVLISFAICSSVWATAASSAASSGDLQAQLQRLQQSMNQANAPGQAPPATGAGVLSSPNPAAPAAVPAPTPAAAAAPAPATPALQPNPYPASPGNLHDNAFSSMTDNTLPLSPKQIELLHSLYDATQRAAAVYPGVPPRPTATLQRVDLSPGATPPYARLAAGFVTSLVFIDATGAPWPIQSYSVGNPTAFNVQWDKNNILLVQAITAYRSGNLAVILKGLNTPIMVDLKTGQAAMDARVDLQVPRMGPNAKPSFTGLPSSGSPILLNLLDDIPPDSAVALKTSACVDCLWRYGGKYYLRTHRTLISPAWIATLSSSDGTHVYELAPTPVILTSDNGKTTTMTVED